MNKRQATNSREPLNPYPQCIECLANLARTSVRSAGGADAHQELQAEQAARRVLARAKDRGLSSPQIANEILRQVARISGDPDPFSALKTKEMETAQTVFQSLYAFQSPDGDLNSLARLAVLGNSLDFFEDPGEVMMEMPGLLEKGIAFFPDQVNRLAEFLARDPGLVLYVADNAGEIYFDVPLYGLLRRHCRRIVLLVKGGPALNDLTRWELTFTGLTGTFQEIADTGTPGAGVDWTHLGAECLALIEEADLIVSKGMANFETLFPRNLSAHSFYLFKVKCEPIRDYVNAPLGSFVALWKNGEP